MSAFAGLTVGSRLQCRWLCRNPVPPRLLRRRCRRRVSRRHLRRHLQKQLAAALKNQTATAGAAPASKTVPELAAWEEEEAALERQLSELSTHLLREPEHSEAGELYRQFFQLSVRLQAVQQDLRAQAMRALRAQQAAAEAADWRT